MQPLNEQRTSIPAFLNKLYKMLNDPNTNDVICWNPEGTNFMILDQGKFWKELLPVYYKHNNIASFIRQLNMYGFHKMANVESSLCSEHEEEIKFYNEMFQRDQPELMKNIKRKVTTTTKAPPHAPLLETYEKLMDSSNRENVKDLLEKVNDLQNQQLNYDSQLLSLRQENTVLWRELASFRQRFVKQQAIVNKLINFLVTVVQPPARMSSGIGVKRHFPLMINECVPKKQQKQSESSSEGPVIHEVEVPTEFNDEEPLVTSPEETCDDSLFTNKCMIENEARKSQLAQELLNTPLDDDADAVLLNPATQDVLLANLMKGSYNLSPLKTKGAAKSASSTAQSPTPASSNGRMEVATRDAGHPPPYCRLNSVEDFGIHVENTQNELDQLKDLFNGCATLDANALLTLFADDSPPYGLSYNQQKPPMDDVLKSDPLVSGSELATYDAPLDFSQLLFDDSSNDALQVEFKQEDNLDLDGSITTPQVMNDAPMFPTDARKK